MQGGEGDVWTVGGGEFEGSVFGDELCVDLEEGGGFGDVCLDQGG
jgi:hypothetical protein